MLQGSSTPHYALGNTDAEHQRLVRQGQRFAPITERLFREAGIGLGQRVLDLGSGVGDVAMLVAELVGPSGEVMGIERDTRSIARARARGAEAGLRNVTFTQSEVTEISGHEPFDAAVGRFILMYLLDPAAALRSLFQMIRPGGAVAFQEPSWAPVLALFARLPLWSSSASLIVEAFRCSGANAEIGTALHDIFQQAGLPPPSMHMDIVIGRDAQFSESISDLLSTLRPQMERSGLKFETLGDFATLSERLQAELIASNGLGTWLGAVIGAWSRKPTC